MIDLIVGVQLHVNPCGSFCVVSQKKGEERWEILEEMKEMKMGRKEND